MENHHRNHPHHLRLTVPRPQPRPFPPPSPFPHSSPFAPFTPSSTPASTPSKHRRRPHPSSLSSSLLLLLSLRSLYSLLPFLRSSPPSFSLFPFSFLVSLLSSLLLLSLSPLQSLQALKSLTLPLLRLLAAKSSLLALSLLLRFQALRHCGTAATILADLSGSLAAKSLAQSKSSATSSSPSRRGRFLGFAALALSLTLLSLGWDRTGCSPLSSESPPPTEGCRRLLPMLLPFLSGFLGFYERASGNWGSLRQLGRKRVRLLSLALTTVMLFFPALLSFVFASGEESGGAAGLASVSLWSLGWPLINTVIFGVILSENYGDDKFVFIAKDFHRDFVVTFFCTLVLELFYFPKLWLPGFLFCAFLLWISVRQLDSLSLNYLELGSSNPSETLYSLVMNPVRHILSDRKSRKIALFLLINAGYMVVEFVAGFMSNSLGLISDACHMLFDCAALAIGLYASYISRLPSNGRFNYGRGRFEVLSGYVNAVFLILVGVLIVLESIERILDPQEISTNSLLIVSVGGFLVNVIGLVFFHEEHHHAHDGGGTCSHSHSQVHSHGHHHDHAHCKAGHDHDCNVEHHRDVTVSYESAGEHSSDKHHHHHHSCNNYNDHQRGVTVSQESSTVHSHDKHHHHSCSNQNDHQHEHKDEIRKETNPEKNVDHPDHHCHDHEHDHHCHMKEHDHCDHPHDAEVHAYQNSGEPRNEHGRLDISSTGPHAHCDAGHSQDSSPGDKENCSHIDLPQATHPSQHLFPHSEKASPTGSSGHKETRKHHHIDHNMEGIFLHVLADTMGSVGVVISTLLIQYKGWLIADPACSIFISVMIISSIVPLLRNSAEILLQRIPRVHEQDLKVARDELMRIKGICSVQNLNVWNLTNTDIIGTVHLHVATDSDKVYIKNTALELMHEAGIKDVTIQVECMKG